MVVDSDVPTGTPNRGVCHWRPQQSHLPSFSDFWTAYQHVFPAETHHGVGKETGETAHRPRWNKTLRQRMSHYVRQTFSFSKSNIAHQMFTKWFLVQDNMDLS